MVGASGPGRAWGMACRAAAARFYGSPDDHGGFDLLRVSAQGVASKQSHRALPAVRRRIVGRFAGVEAAGGFFQLVDDVFAARPARGGRRKASRWSRAKKLTSLAKESAEHGNLTPKQRIMIHRVVDLAGKNAAQIAAPRGAHGVH